MKQFIVNRHTTPATPALEEVPNEKIRVFKNEATIDAALSSLDENEIVATEDGAESSTRIGNPLGTILAIHSNAVPYGYLPCNGVAFDEHQYPALYALLGDNHTPVEGHTLDWDNAESITISTTDYVIQKNGWLVGYFSGSTYPVLLVNGIDVAEGAYAINAWISYGCVQVKVKKGDVVKYTASPSGQTMHLIPYKYYKVIKATSGLEETQQDYVLQSLLEADSYSTEEVATGKKWIDGKMIYRKVLTATNKGTSDITFDGSISDLDTMVSSTGYIKSTTGTYVGSQFCIPRANEEVKVTTSTGTVQLLGRTTSVNADYAYLVVEYTKAN